MRALWRLIKKGRKPCASDNLAAKVRAETADAAQKIRAKRLEIERLAHALAKKGAKDV